MTYTRFPIWCELVCLTCAKTHSIGFITGNNTLKKSQIRKEAQAKGWVFKDDDVYCPNCGTKDHDHPI